MELFWYAVLGAFFATYLVLGGYDYGVGLLLTRADGATGRRRALNALGPFFLGNEVWLVATAGILFGAFPMLEGELLSGFYPAVATALAGVMTVTASVQLRSRAAGERGRYRWDRLITVGSVLAAFGWGAVLAGLLQGVPMDADGHVAGVTHLLTPFVAATGLTLVTLVAVHGATFLALRLPGSAAEAAGRTARRLVPVAVTTVAAATVVGLLAEPVRANAHQPAAAVLLPVLLVTALLVARAALARRRPGVAFAATATALALPVLLIATTIWPYALISTVDPAASLTVADAAASPPTLRLLGWLAAPLLPALLGFQLMSWWMFRGRIDGRAPVYW
ncbi:cytochrome d ubiquinol oxidase subunit II [Micromonospora sp. CPCC 206060]|uniref:cytochrome d ubiquinol oxidase subunit II n=1 Tax=Micromonospora sp. CPCC 206060 TaxID=3122406 RepID=UPI002FF219DD